MCKYNVKDLFDVADDGVIMDLYAAYDTVRYNSRKTLWDNFCRFWDEVNPMVPHNANLLILGIRRSNRCRILRQGHIATCVYPNHPLLQMDNCSALTFDEVLQIWRNEAFLPRMTYEQLP